MTPHCSDSACPKKPHHGRMAVLVAACVGDTKGCHEFPSVQICAQMATSLTAHTQTPQKLLPLGYERGSENGPCRTNLWRSRRQWVQHPVGGLVGWTSQERPEPHRPAVLFPSAFFLSCGPSWKTATASLWYLSKANRITPAKVWCYKKNRAPPSLTFFDTFS